MFDKEELHPADLMEAIETRPERAEEVLREMLDQEWWPGEIVEQAVSMGSMNQFATPLSSLALQGTATTISGLANQQSVMNVAPFGGQNG